MNLRNNIAAAVIAAALLVPAHGAFAEDELLNINTATVEQLAQVPGLNEELANAIVQYRDDMGDIQSMDELTEVPGMSKDLLESIKTRVGLEAVAGAECNC